LTALDGDLQPHYSGTPRDADQTEPVEIVDNPHSGDGGSTSVERYCVRRRVAVAFLFPALTILRAALSSAAVSPPPIALTPMDMDDLRRVATYLNAIHTMTARFRQSSSGGGTATGSLWMARPGRMRFEYDPPSPVLLIADQFYVYYVDKQLAQMSKVGLKSTPAWFLLRDPITFDDLVINRFERGANALAITVSEPTEPDKGSLTMVFNSRPLALRQWMIVDQQRKTTTVSIFDAQFGVVLDPELFVYHDPFAAGRRQYQP
jgi:outer membrane lipoprotein-sorting protein